MGGIYSIFSQGVDGRLPNFMIRKLSDESSIKTIVGKRDGHIRLTSAVSSAKGVGLNETVIAFRSQA